MHEKTKNKDSINWRRLIELSFGLMIVFFLLWLWDDYVANLITLLVVAISSAILLISIIMEAIERSNVPRFYYWAMVLTILTPLLVLGIVVLVN